MNKTLRALLQRKDEALKSARAMTDAAEKAGRDLTAEENTSINAYLASVAALEPQIAQQQQLAEAERGMNPLPAQSGARVTENADQDARRGFASIGEFARAVAMAAINPGRELDDRLSFGAAAPSTFGSESSGADGGFLVPPEFSREVFRLSLEDQAILPMTDNQEISSNAMAYPRDETTPWGTDGIRAFWDGEAAAATAVKPKLGLNTLRMNKLLALVPVTDELMEDTAALDSYIGGKMAESIRWKSDEAFVDGTGVGLPMGILQSPALVTQAAEGGQAVDTININNISKMISRLPAGSYGRAVWMINNDALPQIFTMTLSNYPIYLPSSAGAQGNPYGTLMGRPILVSQHCKTVGDVGDIILADWKYYRTITKRGGIQTATSMHLYFDAAATAFRAIFRCDGRSKIAAAISPQNGATTLSPFVALAAR